MKKTLILFFCIIVIVVAVQQSPQLWNTPLSVNSTTIDTSAAPTDCDKKQTKQTQLKFGDKLQPKKHVNLPEAYRAGLATASHFHGIMDKAADRPLVIKDVKFDFKVEIMSPEQNAPSRFPAAGHHDALKPLIDSSKQFDRSTDAFLTHPRYSAGETYHPSTTHSESNISISW